MVTRHVCDRCKNEVTSFLKMQTERVGSRIRIKGSYLLCDKCAEDFTDHFIDGYKYESNVTKEKLPAVHWIHIAADEKAKRGR